MRTEQSRPGRLLLRCYLAGWIGVALIWFVSGWGELSVAAGRGSLGQPAMLVGHGGFGIGLKQWNIQVGLTFERTSTPAGRGGATARSRMKARRPSSSSLFGRSSSASSHCGPCACETS
jgi:hypothetical protein